MNKGIYDQIQDVEYNKDCCENFTLEMLTEFTLDISKGWSTENDSRESILITGKKMAIQCIITRLCTAMSKTELDKLESYLNNMMLLK